MFASYRRCELGAYGGGALTSGTGTLSDEFDEESARSALHDWGEGDGVGGPWRDESRTVSTERREEVTAAEATVVQADDVGTEGTAAPSTEDCHALLSMGR